ncbi:hypothetical protein N7492_007852 [Penicillium capsulatum]|uniref:Protein SQS1 n=1 Tax=Penicillium capsulatum TaxID=69766 RepID=A0A9W9I5Z6_9EURO|nr:hypothetical protein N7492_007852 [Penicillium capsulatum]
MQQEAQNTETHTRWWSQSNLRHKAVQFVSAGQLQRKDTSDTDEAEHDQRKADAEVGTETKIPPAPEDDYDGVIFLDSTGQKVDTGLPDPVIPTGGTDTDDSSEDEVVFTGRRNYQKPIVIETDKDELQSALFIPATEKPSQQVTPDRQSTCSNDRRTPPPVAPTSSQRHGRSQVREIDTLADYIANIDQDYYVEDDHPQPHADMNGGMDVGQAPVQPRQVGDANEAHVQSSIDGRHDHPLAETKDTYTEKIVLSKMYLDTKAEATPNSDDETAEPSTEDSDTSSEEENDLDDLDLLEDLAIHYSTKGTKGRHSGKNVFPSASAFADALESDPYYGFDIMDFDRPSLRKKSKGKKPPALEDLMLSDSDLDFQIHEAWHNDRKKKKTKKKEREELRSQGLLGRDPGDADLKIKYAKGMNMEDLVTELRSFLLSPKNSLSLPPMTKHRRKAVHELANKVSLKSQSRGNGPTRFPILIKTGRTPKYTRKTIPQFDHLLSGRKLNRRLFQSWGSDASRPSKTKRGATGAAVSYMDGDVVGASAPEIGTENRGRAMLEKMGWSSGTALGANDNKGILQPVAHVVKNSRAGLG